MQTPKRKEHPTHYSNWDNIAPPDAENSLRSGDVYIVHSAWDHWGKMYAENGRFKEEVWVNNQLVDIVEGDSLDEVFRAVNAAYGAD